LLRKDRTRPKRKANRTRTHPNGPTPIEVKDYRHKGEKRKNIPDAGLATYNYKPQVRVKYSYDAHLDPHLVWSGKAERTSFEVETVSLHIHERVSTQAILESVKRSEQLRQLRLFAEPDLPFDRRIEFYQHEMDWANRLILGDSLVVMDSLLERELMVGKVQMIYIDPPYGIAYNSNFQPYINRREVKDGQDESLTREPEQIKAYRDTWTLGIHSYLTYLRDRLLLCRDLLHETGSVFVQISDENIHHVRELMDEIFRPSNFCALIAFRKTSGLTGRTIAGVCDYLLWYAKDRDQVKVRQLFMPRAGAADEAYRFLEKSDGDIITLTHSQLLGEEPIPPGRRFLLDSLYSPGETKAGSVGFEFEGRTFHPIPACHWKTTLEGLRRLSEANRLAAKKSGLFYRRYHNDFPYVSVSNMWLDTAIGGYAREQEKIFVVQTAAKVIGRCILLTTDPGDLVFDPTCGSGTTAYCAERLGRRWITCDTSRVALALTRQRLMTARFDWYKLANSEKGVDGGFLHETVPHVTLKSIAQNQETEREILYDKPIIEHDKVRVSGPFTVEAIPVPVMAEPSEPLLQISSGAATEHVNVMIELLQKDGVMFPGGKKMMLGNLRPVTSVGFVHAEGETTQNGSAVRVAVSFGPRYAPVTMKQVDEAIRSSYRLGFDALVLAGFAFDPEAQATILKNPIPKLRVHMAHISPDVIVGDLLKTTKGSQLFTVFGEPDLKVERVKSDSVVELLGVDIYDPVTGEVHSSGASEVPAWFLDEDYDGYTFRIYQAFFPKEATAKNPWDKLENALRGIVDKEKIEMFRGTQSLPFKAGPQKQIAVKVVDNRGNEVMVVKSLNGKEEAT